MSQAIIVSGQTKKVPKKFPKVSKIDKKGTYYQKLKISIYHMIHSFISQCNSIQKIIQYHFFSGKFNSKKYSFPGKFNSKIDSKILIWLDSIQ